MNNQVNNSTSPWTWVPSLYFAQGIPYIIVNVVSVIFYKRLGLSNTQIAFYTSWLYLPWVIKPLWSPFLEMYRTKRFWVVSLQLFMGVALGAVALTVPAANSVQYTLLFFWLIAFSSATHDIAADGFYMLALDPNKQALFVGIRSTAYRIAMITGQGLLVMLAGYFESHLNKGANTIAIAWSVCFFVIALVFTSFGIYHFFLLPTPFEDVPVRVPLRDVWTQFKITVEEFFQKPGILLTLAFLLIYRFGEAQLVKLASPFLLDSREAGGLGLNTESVGFVYGTVGIIALMVGGIAGGVLVSRGGLKRWIWWMFLAINLPHVLYIFLAYAQPTSFLLINICVAGEQFGYGFGFTAYMIYMLYVSEGKHKTAHYALCTGFMALSMMIPGLISGRIEEFLGYKLFFVWVLVTMVPGWFIVKALSNRIYRIQG